VADAGKDALIAGLSAFAGALAFWVFAKIEEWWRRPRVVIEYGKDYPFRAEALFENGEKAEFLRVRVKNKGRGLAKRCKCFVRHITLKSGGHEARLPSDELMLTSWVPREARVAIMDIPSDADFLADIVHTLKVWRRL
jgi:hypothetical protein